VCAASPRRRQFPNLSVRDTLDFAFAQKTPSPEVRRPVSHDDDKPLGEKDFNAQAKARLLKVFGLEHTEDTPVGDEYVRGVSGGEKKRVSITEVLANRASIQAWDNATRGLDANTALSFTKALRTYADLEQLTAVVSLYQAGNGIYDQFDKVLVLAESQVIFYGRREAAKKYFEEMGFDAVEGANVADYLTGTTVPKERQVRDGFEGKIPQTIDDFAKRYRESDVAKEMRKELDDHLNNMDEIERQTQEAREAIQAEKHKGSIKREPHLRGLWAQTQIAMRREVKQRWGDKWWVALSAPLHASSLRLQLSS
jgi:ATP-binding cassette subfamily G (WHITE) protein 2 (SNQ2)